MYTYNVFTHQVLLHLLMKQLMCLIMLRHVYEMLRHIETSYYACICMCMCLLGSLWGAGSRAAAMCFCRSPRLPL